MVIRFMNGLRLRIILSIRPEVETGVNRFIKHPISDSSMQISVASHCLRDTYTDEYSWMKEGIA